MIKVPRKRGQLVNEAIDLIRSRILDLSIAPGEHLNERYLMTHFRISRTPAREALNRLAAEELVDIHPNRGAFVRPLDATNLRELFEALRVAERLACHFCSFDDPELVADIKRIHKEHRRAVMEHRLLDISFWYRQRRVRIAETCGNRYVLAFCRRVFDQMRRPVSLVYRVEAKERGFPKFQLQALKQYHADTLDCVIAKDRSGLLDAYLRQADAFERRVTEALLQTRPTDFMKI